MSINTNQGKIIQQIIHAYMQSKELFWGLGISKGLSDETFYRNVKCKHL